MFGKNSSQMTHEHSGFQKRVTVTSRAMSNLQPLGREHHGKENWSFHERMADIHRDGLHQFPPSHIVEESCPHKEFFTCRKEMYPLIDDHQHVCGKQQPALQTDASEHRERFAKGHR